MAYFTIEKSRILMDNATKNGQLVITLAGRQFTADQSPPEKSKQLPLTVIIGSVAGLLIIVLLILLMLKRKSSARNDENDRPSTKRAPDTGDIQVNATSSIELNLTFDHSDNEVFWKTMDILSSNNFLREDSSTCEESLFPSVVSIVDDFQDEPHQVDFGFAPITFSGLNEPFEYSHSDNANADLPNKSEAVWYISAPCVKNICITLKTTPLHIAVGLGDLPAVCTMLTTLEQVHACKMDCASTTSPVLNFTPNNFTDFTSINALGHNHDLKLSSHLSSSELYLATWSAAILKSPSTIENSHEINSTVYTCDEIKTTDVLKTGSKSPFRSLVDLVDSQERTLLMFAVMCSQDHLVSFLLSKGADASLTDSGSRTALHLACCNSQSTPVMLKELYLAAPSAASKLDHQGNTPQHYAGVISHHTGLCALWDAGASPCVIDDQHMSLLHLAAKHHDLTLTNAILGKQNQLTCVADFVNSVDKDGNTALHWSALLDWAEGAVILLQHGAQLGATNANGWNSLQLAVREASIGFLGEVLNITSKRRTYALLSETLPSGESLLDFALRLDVPEVTTLLLQVGNRCNCTFGLSESELQRLLQEYACVLISGISPRSDTTGSSNETDTTISRKNKVWTDEMREKNRRDCRERRERKKEMMQQLESHVRSLEEEHTALQHMLRKLLHDRKSLATISNEAIPSVEK